MRVVEDGGAAAVTPTPTSAAFRGIRFKSGDTNPNGRRGAHDATRPVGSALAVASVGRRTARELAARGVLRSCRFAAPTASHARDVAPRRIEIHVTQRYGNRPFQAQLRLAFFLRLAGCGSESHVTNPRCLDAKGGMVRETVKSAATPGGVTHPRGDQHNV